jgi:hypothetical protein
VIRALITVPSTGLQVRLLMLAGALAVAVPLVVAARLTPDPAGLGTHQQLGFSPCVFRAVWGVRCPACGMTTSWAYFVRGQFVASAQANPAGAMLATMACVAVVVLIFHTVAGRIPRRGWLVGLAWGMIVVFVVAVADWAWRLM